MPSRNIPPSPARRPAAPPPGAPEPPPDAPAGSASPESTPLAPVAVASLENPLDGRHWPATEVELVAVTELVPYARNARTHSDEQVAQIMASVREWGFTVPILRDETGMVIAGHGRLLAAQRLKLPEVPVVTARGWSEDKKRAYVIADNKLALNAGWDEALLGLEFAELDREGFDLDLLGFDPEELARILDGADFAKTEGDGDEDQEEGQSGLGSLADRFGIPPFSVLNAREGWWQDRKRAWLALGIQSELGRGG